MNKDSLINKDSNFLEQMGDNPRMRVIRYLIEGRESDYMLTDMLQAGVSWGTLNTLVPKLVGLGIVAKTRKIGRATLYKINLEHSTSKQLIILYDTLVHRHPNRAKKKYPGVDAIAGTIEKKTSPLEGIDPVILKALNSVKRSYKPERMILFGSQARGDTHDGSDVDVILIKNTKKRFTDRIGDVLELWKGSQPLEPIVYTPSEFQKMTRFSDFVKTALKEGVEI